MIIKDLKMLNTIRSIAFNTAERTRGRTQIGFESSENSLVLCAAAVSQRHLSFASLLHTQTRSVLVGVL